MPCPLLIACCSLAGWEILCRALGPGKSFAKSVLSERFSGGIPRESFGGVGQRFASPGLSFSMCAFCSAVSIYRRTMKITQQMIASTTRTVMSMGLLWVEGTPPSA